MTDFWSDARVAEEARLESVYASKAHRGFESPSLRQESLGMRTIGFVIGLPLSQKESPSLRQESLGMRTIGFVIGLPLSQKESPSLR